MKGKEDEKMEKKSNRRRRSKTKQNKLTNQTKNQIAKACNQKHFLFISISF